MITQMYLPLKDSLYMDVGHVGTNSVFNRFVIFNNDPGPTRTETLLHSESEQLLPCLTKLKREDAANVPSDAGILKITGSPFIQHLVPQHVLVGSLETC